MGELELGLRQRVTRYLDGSLPLATLHDWLATTAWNIDAQVDASVAQLYHDVELLLAEYAHGDWTEDELKNRLAPIGAYVHVLGIPGFAQIATVLGSSFSTQVAGGALGMPAAMQVAANPSETDPIRLAPTEPLRLPSERSLALAS